ncbi:MAG: hypothetical protein ACXWDR_05400 [Actinomycetota bacterium]
MSTLPPPPGSPLWDRNTPAFPTAPTPPQLPRWRQAKAGWILLHLAIGGAIWFGLEFAMGFVIAIAGRTYDRSIETDQALGLWTLLLLIASVAGWILFVYLKASVPVRWAVLIGVIAVPFVGTAITLLDRLPPA